MMDIRRGLNPALGHLRVLFANAVWILPAFAAVGAIALASWTSQVEFTTPFSLGGLFTTGGATGARDLVQTVASTSLTVSTVVISVTIVVLQMAGSQYSPRLPGQFLRDSATQIVIGTFIFTFVYSASIIRSISADEEFVPQFAVTVSFVSVLMCIIAFIYYIHHVVQSVRIETILHYIERQCLKAGRRTYELRDNDNNSDNNKADDEAIDLPDCAKPVLAERSGIIQQIDGERIIDFAMEHDLVIAFTKRLGEHVAAGTPFAWYWSSDGNAADVDDEEVSDETWRVIQIGRERDLENDVAFGLTQLTDIALRAVSSAVNDPTTGCNALQSAESVLVQLCRFKLGDRHFCDADDTLRVVVPQRSFDELVDQVVTPIRHVASDDLSIIMRLCELLANLARAAADEHQSRAVADQVERVLRASERRLKERSDRNRVFHAGREVDLALAGRPPRLT